ncbi:lipase [Phlyctema vagabunda]|uniref:Lipase n=1 Tax=Phlyctema vagabunda TaxID=108571 RepID=A0ABR4PG54_9HELO
MKVSCLTVLFVYASTVVAVPLVGLSKRVASVSNNELANLKLFAEYAGAAYCKNIVNNPKTTTVSCKSNGGSCKLVEANKAFVFDSFFEVGKRDTTGFFSIDKSAKRIILAFRGTPGMNSAIFMNNLDVNRDATNICGTANINDKCKVHHGYLESWKEIQSVVEKDLKAALEAYPDYHIVFTGHSLGGAVASIGAAVMRNAGYHIDLYTYGQPRIGSADISNYITHQAPSKGRNYRVTDWNDLVPQLPAHDPAEDAEWDHFGPEYWINKDGTSVHAADIHVIDTPLYSSEGNSKFFPFGWSIATHKLYFGQISACH